MEIFFHLTVLVILSLQMKADDQNVYMQHASDKTWINENDIVKELPFRDMTMQRKPIQI